MTNPPTTAPHRLMVQHGQGHYPVLIGAGLLADSATWQALLSGKVLVVCDEGVRATHLEPLLQTLRAQAPCEVLVLPAGEPHKTIATWQQVLDGLVSMGARRDATVVALGGGVVGDVAGFAAASYMRGIAVVQVPTTLLAQVDASIGGKTGVNHPRGKNLIGAFHAPRAVVIDLNTLQTLGQRDYQAGLAEVVKYGAIRDRAFFEWLNQHQAALHQRHGPSLLEAVRRSAANKAEVVAADEHESGVRATLNFGHSFGHALETAGGYTELLHGEAVAIGMVLAAQLSEHLGRAPAGTAFAISDLLAGLGLPTRPPSGSDPQALMELMRLDKKNRSDSLRLVLLHALGEAVVEAVDEAEVLAALQRSCTAGG